MAFELLLLAWAMHHFSRYATSNRSTSCLEMFSVVVEGHLDHYQEEIARSRSYRVLDMGVVGSRGSRVAPLGFNASMRVW
jgi:hypothetical protein